MTLSSDALLDHIADYLQFISNAQSFWFTLNTSMTMTAISPVDFVWTKRLQGCVASCHAALVSSCHASWLSHHLLSSSHCATLLSSCCASWLLHRLLPSSHSAALASSCRASWLSHCLSPSSCCATLLSTHRASWLSHHLSSSFRCAPRRPLVLSLLRLVVASHLDMPPSRPLVISLCRLLLSCRASWLSCHHLSSSSRCTALSSSHLAGWLLRCLSLRRPLILLS